MEVRRVVGLPCKGRLKRHPEESVLRKVVEKKETQP